MNDFSAKIYALIRKYEQLFIGLILGFLIFLGLSLSAINVILFLLLGTFLETSLIYITVTPKKPKLSLPQAIKEQGVSVSRGRPKGSKNKPKVQAI